jgi:hypothetical protein
VKTAGKPCRETSYLTQSHPGPNREMDSAVKGEDGKYTTPESAPTCGKSVTCKQSGRWPIENLQSFDSKFLARNQGRPGLHGSSIFADCQASVTIDPYQPKFGAAPIRAATHMMTAIMGSGRQRRTAKAFASNLPSSRCGLWNLFAGWIQPS